MNNYHYTECGLDNVYLKDGFTTTETSKGSFVSISNPRGLENVIASSLASLEKRLDNKEIKFLRAHLGYSQSKLAGLLDVSTITLKKWESGENSISGPADRLIKALYKERESNFKSLIDVLEGSVHAHEGDEGDMEFCVGESGNDWSHDCIACR